MEMYRNGNNMAPTVSCSSEDNSSHKLEVAEMGVVTFLSFSLLSVASFVTFSSFSSLLLGLHW